MNEQRNVRITYKAHDCKSDAQPADNKTDWSALERSGAGRSSLRARWTPPPAPGPDATEAELRQAVAQLTQRLILIECALDFLLDHLKNGLTPKAVILGVYFVRQILGFGRAADRITAERMATGTRNLNAGTGYSLGRLKEARHELRAVGFVKTQAFIEPGDHWGAQYTLNLNAILEHRQNVEAFREHRQETHRPRKRRSSAPAPEAPPLDAPRSASAPIPETPPPDAPHSASAPAPEAPPPDGARSQNVTPRGGTKCAPHKSKSYNYKNQKLASASVPDTETPQTTFVPVVEIQNHLQAVAGARLPQLRTVPNAQTCRNFWRVAQSVAPGATPAQIGAAVAALVTEQQGFRSWGGVFQFFREHSHSLQRPVPAAPSPESRPDTDERLQADSDAQARRQEHLRHHPEDCPQCHGTGKPAWSRHGVCSCPAGDAELQRRALVLKPSPTPRPVQPTPTREPVSNRPQRPAAPAPRQQRQGRLTMAAEVVPGLLERVG